MAHRHLILGGARSGKSRLAEQQAERIAAADGRQLIYLATATAGDQEMQLRILRHQADRKQHWRTIEQPLELGAELRKLRSEQCVLIDCLTLWLSNCLHEDCWQVQKQAFLGALDDCPADVLMVSNEVGSGIVPLGELSRQFVDEIGWLHQALAAEADQVTQVIAGLARPLK
ncbi:MAG: bifunctional adenosylcobinamide kinase/adenosylcobinamide-phosphate guanylyltransferase [Pseudomonadota bacterium]